MRDPVWTSKYGDARLIMWDDTNIDFNYKPSLAHIQRLAYSSYYGGNCAKGGVHLQFCGWLGVWDLWTGGVSDSEYLASSNNDNDQSIIEFQLSFQRKDLVKGEMKPFFNILDKGYRTTQHVL